MKRRSVILLFSALSILYGCKPRTRSNTIVLYNGTGTSKNDVEAMGHILSSAQLDYQLLGADDLNSIDSVQLKNTRLLIIPGGNFIEIADNLTKETFVKINHAVQGGLSYLGICAGAFLAGNTYKRNFNFTSVHFPFYAAERKGIRKQPVPVTNADKKTIDQYWEDGPELSGWGEIVSKYPDGKPATVQGHYGSGFIVLTGIHPEAPSNWRKEFYFTTSLQSSHDYAISLVKAALGRKPLAVFDPL